jgi:predicted RNA binding protein YcfA (HicA-like mRNA interferase family)
MDKRVLRLFGTVLATRNNCRFGDIARLLEALGYVGRSSGSSHTTFRRPGSVPITVPFKRPVKRVYVEQVLAIAMAFAPEIEKDEHDENAG